MKHCFVNGCRFNWSHTTSGHICGRCGKKGHGVLECVNSSREEIRNFNQQHGDYILPKDERCQVEGCDKYWEHTTDAHFCKYCNKIGCTTNDCEKFKLDITCPVCKTDNTVTKKFIGIYGIDTKCCVCLDNNANVLFPECKHINSCIDCCYRLNKNSLNFSNNSPFEILSENDIEFNNYGINITDLKDKLDKLDNQRYYVRVYAGMGCEWFLRNNNGNLEGFFMHTDSWGQYGIQCDERPFIKLFTEDYQYIVI